MLPKELLDKFPTVNELLEHPKVKDAARSWNDSTLVARARGALMELGSEISRRTESWQDASPRDMFDRVLHLLDRPDTPPRREVINATGCLSRDGGWGQVPLSQEVIAYAIQYAGNFSQEAYPREMQDHRLKRLTKSEGAIVATSYLTAHEALLDSLNERVTGQGGDRASIVIGGPDVGVIEPGQSLLALCEGQGVSVLVVGSASEVTIEDYLEALESCKEAEASIYLGPSVIEQLLRKTSDDSKSSSILAELIATVHKRNAQVVFSLGDASPSDLEGNLDCSLLSAARALKLGADLVLFRGNGLTGGPAVGLVVGSESIVEPMARALTKRRWEASHWDRLLIDATLTLFEQPERLPFRHPIASLLDAPIDNLRSRAERLALLMEDCDAIESAIPLELKDRRVGLGLKAIDSWGICLTPSAEGGATALEAKIRAAKASSEGSSDESPSIVGELSEGKVILDLRMVLPSQDQQMVCAVTR